MGLFGASNDDVRHQRDRINSLVALQMATMSKKELSKKIKYSDIPFIGNTIFNDMVPEVEDDDGIKSKDFKAKVSINDLLFKIDP